MLRRDTNAHRANRPGLRGASWCSDRRKVASDLRQNFLKFHSSIGALAPRPNRGDARRGEGLALKTYLWHPDDLCNWTPDSPAPRFSELFEDEETDRERDPTVSIF